MVKLTLHSHRGNSNSRFFPHTGYLALTPVKVEGVVRTKLDDDAKPLQASSLSVSVRCIESRIGRLGVTNSNVLVEYTQKLWSKPPNVDWAALGDSEHTFKITIPAHTPGYSCATFKDYRVYWRVEAFIDHSPAFGIGSRQTKGYEISLIRHDTNVPRRSAPVFPGFIKSSKPRAPVIRYHYATPTTPVGPLDIVSIPVTVQPVDPSVSIRGASVIIERRIDLHETSDYTYPSPIHSSPTSPLSSRDVNDSTFTLQSTQSSCAPGPSAYRSCAIPHIDSSVLTLSSTASASAFTVSSASENQPLLTPTVLTVPAKTVSLNVAGAESSGPFDRNSQGVYSKTLTFQWPAPKSHSHWAMGQTMETDLITVRFFAHIKVIISSASSGTETIELEEREIFLVSTNESERKVALGKYDEQRLRTKSSFPDRARDRMSSSHTSKALRASMPTPHAADDRHISTRPSPASAPHTLRRPHTSGGLREKSVGRFSTRHQYIDHGRELHRERDRSVRQSTSVFRRSGTANPAVFVAEDLNVEEVKTPTYACGFLSDPGTVRAWEEELERIEVQSRRSSADMLGFKRKRATSRPNTAGTSNTCSSTDVSP